MTVKIFNPQGSDKLEDRKVWNGNTTNLININNVRFPWAIQLYRQMRQNFWIAEKIDTTSDINAYQQLTEQERKSFNGMLSYLTFLDSIQTSFIPYTKNKITAPEIGLCLSEQLSQETLHNQSYSYLIEAIIPKEFKEEVYNFWREDKVLRDRCKTIASYYQNYVDNQTDENYMVALFADYILEGLYFYSGFSFFYTLASRQLMQDTGTMIAYINRDELSHVRLYQKMFLEAKNYFPYSKYKFFEIVDTAVSQEILWMNHITDNQILGISSNSIEIYIKYLANLRLKAVELPILYEDDKYKKNPYSHLDKIADTGKEASVKANFFEATVSSYNISSVLDGWDEF